jgi:hypothetical protein
MDELTEAKISRIKAFTKDLQGLCNKYQVYIYGSIDDVMVFCVGDNFYKNPREAPYGNISGHFPGSFSVYDPRTDTFEAV